MPVFSTGGSGLEGIFIPTKYPKVRYLPINLPENCKKEKIMLEEEVEYLLEGQVIVEEKMDGKTSMHRGDRFIIFAEDLKYVHSLHYRVPARFAIFDVFDLARTLFLCRRHKEDVFNSIRRGTIKIDGRNPSDFFLVPLVAEGIFKLEELPKLIGISRYAYDPETKGPVSMEGIVVKQDRDLLLPEFKYTTGKIVRSDFSDNISENYLKKPLRENIINPAIE